MNITVTGRNVEVSSALRKYAEDKIGKFDRYLTKITDVTVTLSVEKYRHKAEVLIKANGSLIQAQSVTSELYSSIDEVTEKLLRQLKKHKEKMKSHRKAVGLGTKEVSAALTASAPEARKIDGRIIIERRQLDLKPMSAEEAAMQLDIEKQNFFVFTNSKSGDVNVMYRRKDGNYGLIRPAAK